MQEDKRPSPSPSTSQLYKSGSFTFANMLTGSHKMAYCLSLAKKAATTDMTVLITGESGTGKNLLAQAICNESRRSAGPVVTLNCAALSETLLESELFGHEAGAFTGAIRQQKGRFELAHGGTLILDEVGEMSLAAQVKLLRAVEYRQFERVGGEQTLTSDVRLIALTNQHLEKLVAAKKFRADLLNRLHEIHIEVPPLRERHQDIPVLCAKYLSECRKHLKREPPPLSTAALEVLRHYAWPGNLRELRAVIHRAAVLSEHDHIYAEDLGLNQNLTGLAAESVEDLSLPGMEKRHIANVLCLTKGQKQRACEILQISRPTLDKKIKDYEIEMPFIQSSDPAAPQA